MHHKFNGQHLGDEHPYKPLGVPCLHDCLVQHANEINTTFWISVNLKLYVGTVLFTSRSQPNHVRYVTVGHAINLTMLMVINRHTVTALDVHAAYTASRTPCVPAPSEAVPHAVSSWQPRAAAPLDHASNRCSMLLSSLHTQIYLHLH